MGKQYIYKITYAAKGVDGCIELNYPSEEFVKVLAELEQNLADTGATNIVYTVIPVTDSKESV